MTVWSPDIALIIPARNEELSLPGVLKALPAEIGRVVVVDNGSSDGTAQVASRCGARVVTEPVAGYGRACLAGLAYLRDDPPDIVAFVDGDGSDEPARLTDLIAPVAGNEADLVMGRRVPSVVAALSFQQRFGHLLATWLIRLFWKHRFRDLGPMRVIRWVDLERLAMTDKAFGWTVEMQVRALRHGLRVREIDVPYHPRSAGLSKISRTISGTIRAGSTILWVIGREAVRELLRKRERAATAPPFEKGGPGGILSTQPGKSP
jgi:glycosyltransferase involved in cell wall biosynthesis